MEENKTEDAPDQDHDMYSTHLQCCLDLLVTVLCHRCCLVVACSNSTPLSVCVLCASDNSTRLVLELAPRAPARMDGSTLVACFDASFSPNTNVRIASELELRKVSF